MTDVQVKIELGHRANIKGRPTKEGYTHDWTVYVRGPDQHNISHFIEKVVFHLHETFENRKRGMVHLFVNTLTFMYTLNA